MKFKNKVTNKNFTGSGLSHHISGTWLYSLQSKSYSTSWNLLPSLCIDSLWASIATFQFFLGRTGLSLIKNYRMSNRECAFSARQNCTYNNCWKKNSKLWNKLHAKVFPIPQASIHSYPEFTIFHFIHRFLSI